MILADTHVLVWLMSSDRRLPDAARNAMMADSKLVISAVTAWEYADLQNRGRLKSALPLAKLIDGLSLKVEAFPADAWETVDQLPDIHRDPIDRMLVAHALISGATVATADKMVRRYPIKILW